MDCYIDILALTHKNGHTPRLYVIYETEHSFGLYRSIVVEANYKNRYSLRYDKFKSLEEKHTKKVQNKKLGKNYHPIKVTLDTDTTVR